MVFSKISIKNNTNVNDLIEKMSEFIGCSITDDTFKTWGCFIQVLDASENIKYAGEFMKKNNLEEGGEIHKFVDDIYSFGKLVFISPIDYDDNSFAYYFFISEYLSRHISKELMTDTILTFKEDHSVEYCVFINGVKEIDLSNRHKTFFENLFSQAPEAITRWRHP